MREVYTRATKKIIVAVECPYCECSINLLDGGQSTCRDHNPNGEVLNQAIPGPEVAEDFSIPDVSCAACHGCFDVEGLDGQNMINQPGVPHD